MKIPTNGSGNGYYGHQNNVIYIEQVEVEDEDVVTSPEVQFAEYMWMEHEEEFDKQVKFIKVNKFIFLFLPK